MNRRASTSGSFIRLSEGFTHYELCGPDSGQSVVQIHGSRFHISSFFRSNIQLPGQRRFSRFATRSLWARLLDRPYTRYNLEYIRQPIKRLFRCIEFQKVNLIGLSMGGAIASAFTANFPERAPRLILIDPVGIQSMPLSWMYKAAICRWYQRIDIRLGKYRENYLKELQSDFFNPEHAKMFQNEYRIQMHILLLQARHTLERFATKQWLVSPLTPLNDWESLVGPSC